MSFTIHSSNLSIYLIYISFYLSIYLSVFLYLIILLFRVRPLEELETKENNEDIDDDILSSPGEDRSSLRSDVNSTTPRRSPEVEVKMEKNDPGETKIDVTTIQNNSLLGQQIDQDLDRQICRQMDKQIKKLLIGLIYKNIG